MADFEYPHQRSLLYQFSNNLGTLSSVSLVYIYIMKQLQPFVMHILQYLNIQPMRPLPPSVLTLFTIVHIASAFFMMIRENLSPRNYVLASVGVVIAQICTMVIYLSYMIF